MEAFLKIIMMDILLGGSYRQKGEKDKALEYFQKALAIAKIVDNKRLIARLNNSLGNLNFDGKELEKAMEYYTSALNILNELGSERGITVAYGNMGNIHGHNDDNKSSLEYHQKALDTYKKLEDHPVIGWVLSNMGVIYRNIGNLAKAEIPYKKSYDILKSTGNKKIWLFR